MRPCGRGFFLASSVLTYQIISGCTSLRTYSASSNFIYNPSSTARNIRSLAPDSHDRFAVSVPWHIPGGYIRPPDRDFYIPQIVFILKSNHIRLIHQQQWPNHR